MTAAPTETLTTLDEIVDNFSLLEDWDDATAMSSSLAAP
jgi:hypothetical protein